METDQPKRAIVCLCGSTWFLPAFEMANRNETLKGNIVVTIGVDLKVRDRAFLEATNTPSQLDVPAGYGMVKRGVEDLPSFDFGVPVPVMDSISTILSWIDSIREGREIYHPLDGTPLGKLVRSRIRLDPMFARQITFMIHLNGAQIKAVPDRIKDKVLEWACDLEAAGVTGEGLSFSTQEKRIAHKVIFNISNSHIEQLNNSGINRKRRN